MNLVKYANDCFSETYCYIEVVFLGSAKFRWNRERERRGLNHVLIWFAEVTCLSDRSQAKSLSFEKFKSPRSLAILWRSRKGKVAPSQSNDLVPRYFERRSMNNSRRALSMKNYEEHATPESEKVCFVGGGWASRVSRLSELDLVYKGGIENVQYATNHKRMVVTYCTISTPPWAGEKVWCAPALVKRTTTRTNVKFYEHDQETTQEIRNNSWMHQPRCACVCLFTAKIQHEKQTDLSRNLKFHDW